jgi:hypothetical protein
MMHEEIIREISIYTLALPETGTLEIIDSSASISEFPNPPDVPTARPLTPSEQS